MSETGPIAAYAVAKRFTVTRTGIRCITHRRGSARCLLEESSIYIFQVTLKEYGQGLGGNSPCDMWLRFKQLKVHGIVVIGFKEHHPRSPERNASGGK